LFEALPSPDGNRIATVWYVGNDGSRVDPAGGRGSEDAKLPRRKMQTPAIANTPPMTPTIHRGMSFDGSIATICHAAFPPRQAQSVHVL
jgi:hypothetical protein